MSVRNFNNYTTIGSLTAPVAASATSLSVQNFSNYPTVPFTATLDRNTATEEIVLVTAAFTGTLTVTRGFDGTAAQAHSAGAAIEHTAGAIEYTEANQHVNATVNVHGTTGDLVGAEGNQTIFDKTLVSPLVQADVSAGDAVVAYVPSAASTKNLFRGMSPTGTDVIVVDASGNLNAQSLGSTGDTNVHGNLTVTGTSTQTGAASFAGTVGVTGVATFNGGATVPTGKKLTLTDAPAANTDGANKSYVDGKTWPSSAISDAASVPTVGVVVKRDASGRAQFADPSAAADAATKNYVDINRPRHLGDAIGSDNSTTSTGFTTAVSVAVTIPSGLPAGTTIKAHGFANVGTAAGVGSGVQVTSNTATPQSKSRSINIGGQNGDAGVVLYDTDLTPGARTYSFQVRSTVSGSSASWKAPQITVEVC